MKKPKQRLTLIIIKGIVYILFKLFLLVMRINKHKTPIYFHKNWKALQFAVWSNELSKFLALHLNHSPAVVYTLAGIPELGGLRIWGAKYPSSIPDIDLKKMGKMIIEALEKQRKKNESNNT